MFRIIATIVMSLNGQPAAEPMQLANRLRFDTMEACDAARVSEPLAASLAKLEAYVSSREKEGMTHVITMACEAASDDGSI